MHHHRFKSIQRLWLAHFLVGILVLIIGMISNGGMRKYIPLQDVNLQLQSGHESSSTQKVCSKAYINVHAASHDEPDAGICCDDESDAGNYYKNPFATSSWYHRIQHSFSYRSLLCRPWSKRLPFGRMITRFPDSWILPLIPILLRIILDLYRVLYLRCTQQSPSSSSTSSFPPIPSRLLHSIRRLVFFHLIMQFRGWGLYVVLEEVEDAIIAISNPSSFIYPKEIAKCWYSNVQVTKSKVGDRSLCKSQDFDFSDHVVYFYAHVLPPLIFEALFCLLFPFWQEDLIESDKLEANTNRSTDHPLALSLDSPLNHPPQSRATHHVITIHSTLAYIIHVHFQLLHSILGLLVNYVIGPFLLIAFLYLNVLAFLAIHTTAAVFHTVHEVLLGYCISLVVQIPLGVILCTERWSSVRKWFGFRSVSSKLESESKTM